MKVLNTLGITLLLLGFSSAHGASFECPYINSNPSLVCKGSIKFKSQAELDAYKSNLGVKPKKLNEAKNLVIDFDMNLTSDFTLSTPCEIRVEKNRKMNSSAKVCLHGLTGVNVGEYFSYTGGDLTLESSGSVGIQNNAKITAPLKNIRLQSLGTNEKSQAFIRHDLELNAKNLILESKNKGFIGRNSLVTLEETLGIYTAGDDEASIRLGSRVTARKIEVASLEETRIADQTILTSNEIILNGAKCLINKNAVITASERFGNCFLQSQTKAKFFVDKNNGSTPLTISFNASEIKDATSFEWSFGDGEVLTTTTPTTSHQYTKAGIFTATLKYKVKKSLKSAGSIQINVKEPVIVPTTPPRGFFNYFQEESGTFVYLKAFIRRTQFDIAKAYYIINDDPARRIDLTNFNANSQSNFDAGSFGTHKVTLFVEDKAGQKFNTTNFITLKENFREIAPVIRFTAVQSAVNTVFVNMNASFVPLQNEIFKTFTVDYGDGFVETIEDNMTSTHTYAVPGSYNVRVTATFQGNTSTATVAANITSQNLPAVSPVSGFEYFILDFAGNVTFADERSGTPNGEIISYEWNLGDGTITYGKKISHFFNPGEYLVSLTVTDTAGLRATQTQRIKIASEGDDLVSQLSCYKEGQKTIECNIFALDKENQIQRVKVEWGDGTSQIITNPEIAEWGLYFSAHEYAQYGTYNVKLTVDTTRGETKYSFHQETFEGPVVYPPVAMINCNVNHLLVFCGSFGSYDPQGGFLKYKFEYGNLYTDNNLTGNSSYSFSESGLFSVKLTVTNDAGLSTSAETFVQVVKPIPVNQLPIASFECRSDSPFTAICSDTGSVDLDGEVVIRKLTYDDGTFDFITPGQNALHIFISGGDHSFTYTVTDEDGGENTVTKIYNLKSNVPPVASFECSTPGPYKLSCYSTSTDPDAGDMPVKFTWVYDQGKIIEGLATTFDYTFATHGEETIKLIVEDQYGLKSEVVKQFTTLENQAPTVNISCVNTAGASYQCFGATSDTDGRIISRVWTIGTTTFSGDTILYEFKNGGEQNIQLKVVDDLGKETVANYSVNVQLPIAQLACSIKNGYEVTCSAENSGSSNADIIDYQIDFNGDYISRKNVDTFEFISSGEKTITLKVLDENGKVSTSSTFINLQKIYKLPDPDFLFNVDIGGRVIFDASYSTLQDKTVVNFSWKIGDNQPTNISNKIFETNLSPNQFYPVELTVVDERGATKTIAKQIFVYEINVHDPGPDNELSIIGVDSDSDGIRDDIQRIIARLSLENLAKKKYLTMLAKTYESNIRNKENELIIKKNFQDGILINQCIELISGKELSEQEISLIDIYYHNTDERFKAQKSVEIFLGGEVVSMVPEDKLQSTCEAL